jgi:hypothetical protein
MNQKPRYGTMRSEKVKEFVKEIIKVCKKHNLSISHEDQRGGFEIENYDDCFTGWFSQASDRTNSDGDK